MSLNESFMGRAIELAVANIRSERGGPFGAVIVRDGTILAEAANSVFAMVDPTAHAEVIAIREACRAIGNFELRGCELYTSCEPCPMCMGAIYWARLDRVYYGNTREDAAAIGFDDSFIYEQLPLHPHERAIPMIRLATTDMLAPFREWEGFEGRKRY